MGTIEGPKVYKRKGRSTWNVRIDGKRVSTGYKNKRAAQLKAVELEREAASPAYRASKALGLRAALEGWIEDRRAAGRAEATITFYDEKGGHLARLLGADTPIGRLTHESVKAYIKARRGEYVIPPDEARDVEGKPVAEHTIAKELGALRSCLRWARSVGLYEGDPAAVLPIGFSSKYKPRRLYYTIEQAWALIRAFEAQRPGKRGKTGPARAAHVAYLFGTAARWSESVRARPEHVALEGGLVAIKGSKTEGADRTVPVLDVTRPFLEYALKNAPGKAGQRLFLPWSQRVYDLERVAVRAGLPKASPNDMRRSLGSWLVQAGVPLDLVADMLGHTTTAMVRKVYGVRTPETTGATIDRYFRASKRGRKGR